MRFANCSVCDGGFVGMIHPFGEPGAIFMNFRLAKPQMLATLLSVVITSGASQVRNGVDGRDGKNGANGKVQVNVKLEALPGTQVRGVTTTTEGNAEPGSVGVQEATL